MVDGLGCRDAAEMEDGGREEEEVDRGSDGGGQWGSHAGPAPAPCVRLVLRTGRSKNPGEKAFGPGS